MADDGHASVYMLFTFEIEHDGDIVWRLLAYDAGGLGLRLADNAE